MNMDLWGEMNTRSGVHHCSGPVVQALVMILMPVAGFTHLLELLRHLAPNL